jgi:predicted RND superfamily exporter protein
LIAIVGFATLWTFDLQPMRELGLCAAVGTAGLLLLAVVMTPAAGLLLGMRPTAAHPQTQSRVGAAIQTGIDSLVAACARMVTWLATGNKPWGIIIGIGSLCTLVTVLFLHGGIPSYTKPLEFLRGTLVDKSAAFLNRPGQVGFSGFGVLVEPAQGADGKDPRFLRRAWELQTVLTQLPHIREVSSVLSTIHQIAQESWKKPFPDTSDEVDAAFVLIESRLAPTMQRHLYFPGGVRVSVSFGDEPSTAVGELLQSILEVARQDFPELKVSTFTRSTLYPAVDNYIREGKVSNVITSQFLISFLYGVLVYWRNRELTTQYLCPVRGGLVMALPLFFAAMVMGLLMWLLEIPLDMSTAPIGALAINAATDFSLYFAMTYQRALTSLSPLEALHEAMSEEGRVIVADCLLNSLCFLPLVTSHFLPVRQVGWIMGVMLVTCALGTLIFMAALLPRCVVARAHA